MAAILQFLEHAGADGGLQPHAFEKEIMGREKARKMLAAELRRLDRLLQIHAEHQPVQEELQLPLILLIAAHAAESHPGFAVLRYQRWADGGARPFVRRHY